MCGSSEVTVMVSTNQAAGKKMLNKKLNPIVWASDNLETVAHYYEGCVLEMVLTLHGLQRKEYVSSEKEALAIVDSLQDYTFGIAEMSIPANARWYSFSSSYLTENLLSIKEIFPDLGEWQSLD